MAFPILRKLLYAAPVFAAAGIAAACGPYGQPGAPSAPGISMPAPPMNCAPPAPPAQITVPAPALRVVYESPMVPPAHPSVPGTSLSVLDGKIQVQTADGARMVCEKLTILVGGVDPAEVSAAGNLIRIASGKDVKDGDFLQATAQKVTRTASDGAQLVLEGNAKLLFVRKGKKLEVSTDLLSVNLSTGQVLSEMDSPKPTAPMRGTTSPPPGSSYPITPETPAGTSSPMPAPAPSTQPLPH